MSNQISFLPPATRKKPKRLMHVFDAGNGYEAGDTVIQFQCIHCDHNTGWIKDNQTMTENRRGIPCPICNEEAE